MTQLTYSPPATVEDRPFVEEVFKYLGVLRRGWHYVAVSLLVSLTIAALYLIQSKPVYKGSARLLILHQGGRTFSNIVAGGRNPFEDGDDPIPTHIVVIRSPAVIERALSLAGIKNLSVEQVAMGLTVTRPDPAVNILEIGYQAETSKEAIEVVDAVVSSYKKFIEENYQKNASDAITLVAKVRDELSEELKDLEAKYLEFHQKHPVFAIGANGHSLLVRRLEQWDAAANESNMRAVKLQAQLELARKLNEEGAGLGTIGTTLRYLGGEKDDTPLAGLTEPTPDGSAEQVAVELAEIERQRRTSERLLDYLRVEHAAASAAKGVSEREVSEAFYADPEAERLRQQLATARARKDAIQRMVRSPADPSLAQAQRRVKSLQDELSQLWEQRRPAIVESVGRGSDNEVEAAIRREEAALIVLKSRESVLREEVEAMKPAAATLARWPDTVADPGGLVAVREAAATPPHAGEAGRPDQVRIRAMLDSISRGLKANETMKLEMSRRFKDDLAAGKEAEIERLEEENLRANLERQRTLFNSVVDQLKQAQLVSDHSTITAQIVNPATARAIQPRKSMVLGAAMVIGCGLGIGFALLANLFDDRLRTLSSLRETLDFSVLGLIPKIGDNTEASLGSVAQLSHFQPRSVVAEAYKSIRTNLDFQRRSRPVQVIVITSASSGDGKSVSASNVAISMAHAGRKVLLVDADMRRPSLHKYYDRDRSRGLVLVLKGLISVAQAVQKSPVENLDLLVAGPDVPNPAELLASPRFTEFLNEVRGLYDTVIIDSPPLLAVADPLIIASLVDGLVLIARPETIHRHEAERTAEMLRALGTPVLGIVINGITRDQMSYGYGYKGGYGYGYVYGRAYGSSESEPLEADGDPTPALEHAPLSASNGSTNGSAHLG